MRQDLRQEASREQTTLLATGEASPKLGEATHERLRAMILSGELPAGTRLQEKPLAERLGVSRTPVREAIARLSSEGLVSRAVGGAPTVSTVSVTEIMEILHVRRLLECEAARQAATVVISPEPFLALRSRVEKFLGPTRPDPQTHMRVDEDLHGLIARASGSTLLHDMILGLKLKTRMYDKGSIPERFEPGCHEHIAILDGIIARDPERAEAAMRTHLENVRAGILTHLSRLF
ncbi:GntR family transcriptional regulator [Salinarimonas ramus]|uniref:GntR family transcriptional regulator n=1 Tax=Salinarimonas ramus TaxID=690164 RepID=A0A917Q6Y8_9HYPH|nr:GntR family transcriptional regulator [Salinarimonas ramus]GGK31886.1 GntR family transcriptional regulator [Salinarimonas ramus]